VATAKPQLLWLTFFTLWKNRWRVQQRWIMHWTVWRNGMQVVSFGSCSWVVLLVLSRLLESYIYIYTYIYIYIYIYHSLLHRRCSSTGQRHLGGALSHGACAEQVRYSISCEARQGNSTGTASSWCTCRRATLCEERNELCPRIHVTTDHRKWRRTRILGDSTPK
jgi:hypothetical protein